MSESGRLLVIQHQSDAPPLGLVPAARAAGLDVDIRVVDRGDPIPGQPGDAGGLVVLGGSLGVADARDVPHLRRVMDLIVAAAEEDVPYLGVCLGGQLAAAALGGRVDRGASGMEIGWVEVRPTEAGRVDPVTRVVGEGLPLFQWHQDVFEPPPGSTPLLTSDRYPEQGFRLGRLWALQPHPEIDPATIVAWASAPPGPMELAEAGVSLADLLPGAEERGRAASALLDAWCRLAAGRTDPAGASAIC